MHPSSAPDFSARVFAFINAETFRIKDEPRLISPFTLAAAVMTPSGAPPSIRACMFVPATAAECLLTNRRQR